MKKITFLSILLTLFVAIGFSQNGSVPELIYYKFNSPGTSVINHASSPAGTNPAPITGLTIGSGGMLGTNALLGTGQTSTSNVVTTGWNTAFTGDFTLAFWTSNVPTSSTLYYIFGDAGATSFRCFTNGVAGAGNWMVRGPFPDVTFTNAATSTSNMMHVVYDATALTITGYLNGVQVTQSSVPSALNVTGTGLTVGGYTSSSGLAGALDEFRWYNRALSAQEVSNTYNVELPLMGAPNDAAVLSVDSPDVFCSGTQNVVATIANYGSNQMDSVDVHWEVDGVPQPTLNYKQLLDTINGSNPYTAQINLGSYNFTAGSYNIKVYTSMPNGVADTTNLNDTVSVTVGPSLPGGSYTVNANQTTTGSNYQSFGDLIGDLNAYGICGPVVVDVVANSGPYNETLSFRDISGTSATNTIRINGNGNTVEFTNTLTDRQLLTLDGTKYLTIDNLKFKSLDATYGWGALITGGAEYDSIVNCEFDLTSITGTSSANSNGIIFSGSNTSATTAGENGSNCYIAHNHIKGGGSGGPYYGISVYGASSTAYGSDSNTFAYNIVENFYYYGIRFYYTKGTKAIGNEIHRATKTATTTYYGLYAGYSPEIEIIANRLHSPGGVNGGTSSAYGIYMTQSADAIVANNAVYNMNQGGIIYGIYGSTIASSLIYHNTIDIDQNLSSSSTNYGIYATGTNTATEIKNNIVSITGGGTGIKYGFYYSTAVSVDDAQKNNIYVNSTQSGTQNYGYFTTAYATQNDFQTAYPNLEINSPSVDPDYINPSTGDYSPNDIALIGTGENVLAVVPTDINGLLRSTSPTIGAFEALRTAKNDAALMSFVTPLGSYCDGQQSVSVLLTNAGINQIDSVEIHWEVNGVAQAAVHYKQMLDTLMGTGSTSDTVLLGNANIPNTSVTEIRAWAAIPNGVADTSNLNDTIVDNFKASTFTVSLSSDTICYGADARLSLTPSDGYELGDITWQKSTDNVNFVNILNSDAVDIDDTVIVEKTWYRANIGGSTGCYSDTVMVEVEDVNIISVNHGSVCDSGQVTLGAVASAGVVNWYENYNDTEPIDTGSTFQTPKIFATDTFYVSAVSGGGGGGNVGPVDNTIGTTGNYTSSNHYLLFTVHKATVIKSVDAISDGAGLIDVDIQDASTQSTLHLHTLNVTSGGMHTLVLNQALPPGDYRMGTTTNNAGGLQRNNAGANFPYLSNDGSVEITGTTFNSSSYYFFYNWELGGGCESPKSAVIAAVYPNLPPVVDLGNDTTICEGQSVVLDAGNIGSDFIWSTGDTTQSITVDSSGVYIVDVSRCAYSTTGFVRVTVNPSATADSISYTTILDDYTFKAEGALGVDTYLWSFGDSSATSTDAEPTHTYAQSGSYTVTLIVSNDCGSDTLTQTVNHTLVGIDNHTYGSHELSFYPNPTKGSFTIATSGLENDNAMITIRDISGKVIVRENIINSSSAFKKHYSLEGQAKGLYLISIIDGEKRISKKLILQ